NLSYLLFIEMAQGLNVGYLENGTSKRIGVGTHADFRLIRISHPRQIRENEYFVQRQREDCVRAVEPDIRVVIAATPLGPGAASAVVNGNGVVRNYEFCI